MDSHTIVWIIFFIMVAVLGVYYGRKLMGVRKKQQEMLLQFEENKEKYYIFTETLFDETPTDELTQAVIYHIISVEDRMYLNEEDEEKRLVKYLSEGEKNIYTLYQVEMSMEGGRGSIHNFFLKDEFKDYVPLAVNAFRTMNCYEIADLLESAQKLATIIEEDLDDDELIMEGPYAKYNFADYTNEILTQLKSSGILSKAGLYIRSNKEEFVTKEGERDEEGISD